MPLRIEPHGAARAIVLGAQRPQDACAGGSTARTGSTLRLESSRPSFGLQADTTWTQGALVIALSRRWFSLTGTEQSAPDATTDPVQVTSRIAGTDSTARDVVTVGHTGTSSIGGLNPLRDESWLRVAQADTLISHFTALHRPVTRWFEGRTTTTATAYRDGARLDVEKSWSATIVVTFNGTPYPDVAINGSWFYVWDLETGAIYRGNSAWAAPRGREAPAEGRLLSVPGGPYSRLTRRRRAPAGRRAAPAYALARSVFMSVNKVILIGNLGKKPELRYTPGGQAVAQFNIATNERWGGKDGQPAQERTEWHRIVVWGRTAENCAQYLDKGRSAYVEGRLQTREWTDKEGQKKYTTEVIAQTVQFLGGKGGGAGGSDFAAGGGDERMTASVPAGGMADEFSGEPGGGTGDDDLPF